MPAKAFIRSYEGQMAVMVGAPENGAVTVSLNNGEQHVILSADCWDRLPLWNNALRPDAKESADAEG